MTRCSHAFESLRGSGKQVSATESRAGGAGCPGTGAGGGGPDSSACGTLGPQGTPLGKQGKRARQQGPQTQSDPPDLCFSGFPAPWNGGG